MDLIEIIDHYQFILKARGRKESQTFLHHVHVHNEVQKAIIACFDNSGTRRT